MVVGHGIAGSEGDGIAHLDGELQKIERTTRETLTRLGTLATTYAPIASPVFTGDPQAPTPLTADNDTSIATTGYVKAQGYLTAYSTTLTGDVTGSGWASFATTIAAGVVTFAKMATAAIATAANYASNAASVLLTPNAVWSSVAEVTLTDASSVALDLGTGFNFVLTATSGVGATRALANPTNAKVGQSGYIRWLQDSSGSRALTFGSSYQAAGGIAVAAPGALADGRQGRDPRLPEARVERVLAPDRVGAVENQRPQRVTVAEGI